MADKDLRKMSRAELVEIIYALQKEEKSLKEENEELKNKLNERTIDLEEAGSIAVASLQLNGVFQSAQAAADTYVESVKAREQTAQDRADKIIQDAEEQAQEMLKKAQDDIDQAMSELQNSFRTSPVISKYLTKDENE